jgi:hypothetical protein
VFVWRYLDEAGEEKGSSDRFAERDQAESWLSEEWAGLRDRGVEEVVLFDDDRGEPVYRMGLGPESG